MKFTAEKFTPTEWDTAQNKADFANRFVAFVESGYKESLFTKAFYNRLSMTFGHIAHYNREGFYGTYFTSAAGRVRFAEATLQGGGYGSPSFTYCDVERAIKAWAIETKMLENARYELDMATEEAERGELARLQKKYA